ncbi:MAG: M48 family metallopeptidase [Sulfurimonas sp.]|nr:M48 family metallopeptidase [Sulfurimonas sp.]
MKMITLIVSIILFTGCFYESSTGVGSVGVERKQLLLVSSDIMNEGAVSAYSKILEEAKKKNILNIDKKQLSRLRVILSKLVKQTYVFRKDALNWKWEVNLITSDDINAWCMPGGKIVFYTGIIDELELTEDEIAAIMGHEIAHALREHARERSSQGMLTQGAFGLSAQLLGIGSTTVDLASWVTNVAILLPNNRFQETESDRIGVELSARAGYNPDAAVSVWKKMKKLSDKNPPEFLSTHPSHDNRINDLQTYAKRVKHLYKTKKEKYGTN